MELITERGRASTYDGFAWSFNYVTAEIVNLTGRKASYSKTIKVPYDQVNRLIWEGLDEFNVDNVGYNTKSSLKCFAQHNGRVQMTGSVIVKDFYKIKEEWVIELQLISSIKNIITSLKGISLRDLDFSRWNHEYIAGNIVNNIIYGQTMLDGVAQQFEQGKGYVYPLIDFGKDDTEGEIRWTIEDLRPCLYLKEVMDTVFRTAGKTYTSDFFESPYFRSLTLENTVSEIVLSAAQKDEFQTEIENVSGFKTYTDDGGTDLPNPGVRTLDWYENFEFDNEVTDPLDQWDIITDNEFTAPRNGEFKFEIQAQFYHEWAVDVNHPDVVPFYTGAPVGSTWLYPVPSIIEDHYLQITKNGITFDEISWQGLNPEYLQQDRVASPTYPVDWIRQAFNDPTPDQLITKVETFVVTLNQGDTIKFRSFEPARIGTAPFAQYEPILHRFNFQSFTVTTELQESQVFAGDIINFANYIPNIKADALIDGVFNHFNLWVIDDKFNDDNMIIEPRTNFFNGGGYLRMSKKLDRSKKIQSDFLADKLPKRYRYKFQLSDDVLNVDHNELNDLPYADYDSEVDIDFTSSEQTIESIFSPIITQEKNGLFYPLEHTVDAGVKGPIGSFLKIGFVSQKSGDWELKDEFGGVVQVDKYLCISEFDSIENPNYSLTFGDAVPKFNQIGKAYWNLWRLCHQLTEEEQTRDGSMIVGANFNLNENDISDLDLRTAWFIDGVYFRIVTINNVNPETNTSTLVRLLQVDNPKFDFTTNEMIYKLAGITKVLATSNSKIINTQKGYVQLN